jgi:hypothetical protein
MNHQEILERVWTLLERGTTNRKDDFHTCALATIGLNGGPEIRTVVLRKVFPELRILLCHVDLRSPKIAEIEKESSVSWLFYHVEEKLQLRIRGRATIQTNSELADLQWENTGLFSRRCYCGDAPGTSKSLPSTGLPGFLIDREPTLEESEQLGRENFAVLSSTIDEIDVYELHVRGHRRSLFKWNERGALETHWLTP